MLVVYGNIYSSEETYFNEIKELLEENGYQLAYNSSYNAMIIKEIVDEEEE